MGSAETSEELTPRLSVQIVPLVHRNLPARDGLELAQHHPKLRDGILFVGWNCESVLPENHELMFRPRVRAVEAKLPQAAHELVPLTRTPLAHEQAPCSD